MVDALCMRGITAILLAGSTREELQFVAGLPLGWVFGVLVDSGTEKVHSFLQYHR